MPTNATDQFFTFDPANPPPAGTSVSFTKYVLTDQNDDGDVDEFDDDAVTGLDVTASWPGDTVTINVPGTGNVTYSGTTLYLSDGGIIFTPTDGQVLEGGEFVSSTYVTVQGPLLLSELGPPCFLPGTLISTPNGQRPIEQLCPGDLIDTIDRGPVPLMLLRRRLVSLDHLVSHPRHAPIRIPAGSIGANLPCKLLRVSPQHRLLLSSKAVSRMYGFAEVLSPAAQLDGYCGVKRENISETIEYIHLLFDHHAIILANGLPTESLYLGTNVLKELNRAEYFEFKSNLGSNMIGKMEPARPFVSGKKLKQLLNRHVKNKKPLLDEWSSSRSRVGRLNSETLSKSA